METNMEQIELQEIIPNGNDGSTYVSVEREHANGHGEAWEATETDRFIPTGTTGSNGTVAASNPADEYQINTGNTDTPPTRNSLCRVKTELNELIFWKVRLWMIIIFIFVLILAVIMISLLVCSAAIHEDIDENFDPSLFIDPLHFNGSFKLPNLVFKEELLTHSSNESQALAANFKEKLNDLYRTSPALGRYFSEAEIQAFRNGSVIADFHLKFLMPKEEQGQLRNFTLSREMVYNVFRQFLYDQELEKTDPMYIDPVSLHMFLG